MLDHSILPHRQHNVIQGVMLVRTRRPLWAPQTGVIIPAGTLGKVLSTDNQIFVIDFQLSTVHRIAADSPVIEIVRA